MPLDLRNSVRRKLMFAVVASTFAALLITALVLVVYEARTYRQALIDDLRAQADILGQASAAALSFDDPRAAQQNLELLRVRPGISAAAIYTARETLFASFAQPGATPLPSVPGRLGVHAAGDQLVLVQRISDRDEVLGTIALEAKYGLPERLRAYLGMVVAVMGVSLLAAALLSGWLQASVTGPIRAMTEIARQVKVRRDFSLRARKSTEDEIGYLVDSFNDMLDEVGYRTQALERANRTLEHEMTIRHEAERALRLADQRKDEFLAMLAHELRNPLAPLRNALEILRLRAGDPGASKTAREIMDRQLRQMVRLVDDLLDVSRITTGKLTLHREPVALQDVVRSALDAAAPIVEARGLELAVTMPAEPLLISADPTRLAQVILNLLNNAAKFTEPGGRLTLTVERPPGEVVVKVADNGIGIPREQLDAIFDMFAQLDRSLERPHGGLGVGLSLARRLVELHGGTLTAESDGPGRGSVFVVRLPVALVVSGSSGAPNAPAAGAALDGAPTPLDQPAADPARGVQGPLV